MQALSFLAWHAAWTQIVDALMGRVRTLVMLGLSTSRWVRDT